MGSGSSKTKPNKTPYDGGTGERLKNLAFTHFRGILGFIILVITTAFAGSKENRGKTVYCLWITMFLFLLIHPVAVPVTGMMPVFYLVLFGVLASDNICKLYYGSGQALFMLAGMVGMLLNISKFDRRMIFFFLNPDNPITPIGFLIKVSLAAYFPSVFSNKLLVSSYLIELLGPAFNNVDGGMTIEYRKYRNIIMNAIQTSSSIGGMAFIHGSLTTLTMKTIYEEQKGNVFNYYNFLPVFVLAKIMFGVNLIYHIILIKVQIKDVSAAGQASIKNALSKGKSALPPNITAHEIQTVVFLFLAFVLYMSRVTKFGGWQTIFNPIYAPDDFVVSAFIVILLSVLPKGCSLLQVLKASKQSEMPPCKPESAIMFWKFVDKNTIYGYLFLIGGGNALNAAIQKEVATEIPDHIGKIITFGGLEVSLIVVTILSVILANIMTPVAAVCMMLPLVISSYSGALDFILMLGTSRAVLMVGLAGSLSFAFPFKFTCAYYVHKVGRVPKRKMCVLGAGSAAVCTLPLLSYALSSGFVY